MKGFFSVAKQSFLVLLRERVFSLTLLAGFCAFGLALLTADLSLEEAEKSLFDYGFASFHILGGVFSILMGVKLFGDVHAKGTLAGTQLVHRHTRVFWLLARFLGLTACLLVASLTLQLMWQGMLIVWGYSPMGTQELLVFNTQTLEWWVLATLASMLGIISSPLVALFVTICLWLAGLISAASYTLVAAETSKTVHFLFLFLEKTWNLQRFNLARFYGTETFPSQETLMWLPVYGFCLAAIFITAASFVFEKKDVY
jgi:hypothetical protein